MGEEALAVRGAIRSRRYVLRLSAEEAIHRHGQGLISFIGLVLYCGGATQRPVRAYALAPNCKIRREKVCL
jgi:hypothetical protein